MDFSTTSTNYAPPRDVLDRRSSTYACVAQFSVRPDLAHIWRSRHEKP